jgi:hypothetical protein
MFEAIKTDFYRLKPNVLIKEHFETKKIIKNEHFN